MIVASFGVGHRAARSGMVPGVLSAVLSYLFLG